MQYSQASQEQQLVVATEAAERLDQLNERIFRKQAIQKKEAQDGRRH